MVGRRFIEPNKALQQTEAAISVSWKLTVQRAAAAAELGRSATEATGMEIPNLQAATRTLLRCLCAL